MQALTGIVFHCPAQSAAFLTEEFYASELSLAHRRLILNVLVLGAIRLSGRNPAAQPGEGRQGLGVTEAANSGQSVAASTNSQPDNRNVSVRAYACVCLSVSLSLYLPLSLSLSLSLSLTVCLPLSLSDCLSASLSLSL